MLASSGTSGEQKAAARDVLQRLVLENAKREQELADLQRRVGQLPAAGAMFRGGPAQLPTLQGGALPVVIEQVAPLLSPAAAPLAAVGAAGGIDQDALEAAIERGLSRMQLTAEINGVLTPAVLKVAAQRGAIG